MKGSLNIYKDKSNSSSQKVSSFKHSSTTALYNTQFNLSKPLLSNSITAKGKIVLKPIEDML